MYMEYFSNLNVIECLTSSMIYHMTWVTLIHGFLRFRVSTSNGRVWQLGMRSTAGDDTGLKDSSCSWENHTHPKQEINQPGIRRHLTRNWKPINNYENLFQSIWLEPIDRIKKWLAGFITKCTACLSAFHIWAVENPNWRWFRPVSLVPTLVL